MRSGMLAEFESPEKLLRAYEALQRAGFTRLTSFTPYPVKGLVKKLPPSMVPWIVLVVGLSGSTFMLWFETYAMGSLYPMVVGGKPLFSLPAFVPIWYEITVLSSCITAFLANWILSGLPRPNHPAFNSKAFERVTDDKFFIMIESEDPKFDAAKTREFLSQTGASHVEELAA